MRENMKHLHLMNTDKFIEPYIKMVNANFYPHDQYFFCFLSKEKNHLKNKLDNMSLEKNVLFNKKVVKSLYEAERIYVHSLFSMKIVLLLFLHPWLLKKCYWVIWGADLYAYRKTKTLKYRIKEFFRAPVIRRFGNIVSLVEGDYHLAKQWYGARGKYCKGSYGSTIVKADLDALPPVERTENHPVVIQIGNSADPANQHIEVLRQLARFKQENLQIIVPLSYGDLSYAKTVIEAGVELFGDKFRAITDYLSPEAYSQMLNEVDIAIFNNDRQQALGNISILLYLNKTVYIRSDTTMWAEFQKDDFHLHDYLLVNEYDFGNFCKKTSNPKRKTQTLFDESKLVEVWDQIFS